MDCRSVWGRAEAIQENVGNREGEGREDERGKWEISGRGPAPKVKRFKYLASTHIN